MSVPVFYKPKNNAGSTLSSLHAIGDGQLVVASGTPFGSPSTPAPIRVVVTDGNNTTMFGVTSVSGNTLTISTTLESTSDHNFSIGSSVEIRLTAGDLTDLQTSIVDIFTNYMVADPSWLTSVSGSKVTGTLSDSVLLNEARPNTTVFNANGSITQTYTSGLVVTTTFPSNGSIVTAYGSPISKTKTTVFNSDGSITDTVV